MVSRSRLLRSAAGKLEVISWPASTAVSSGLCNCSSKEKKRTASLQDNV